MGAISFLIAAGNDLDQTDPVKHLTTLRAKLLLATNTEED